MPSLKDLRNRIASVKSTQKITSAMKMVAAAKLRRAQEQAEASRPYAERMERMLGSLAENAAGQPGAPELLVGSGRDDTHLIVVATADRGLCGGFNSGIVREAKRLIESLKEEGKTIKILCVGRKGMEQLRRDYANLIIETIENVTKPSVNFDKAKGITGKITELFQAGEFDVCTIIFARFKSAISQIVTPQQLIPFAATEAGKPDTDEETVNSGAVYEFEPEEKEILDALLPLNLSVQVFKALLENNASEQGARMTAMDNATRNAGEMIGSLTLQYNRARQAGITKELIEIVSGAEAL